MNISKNKIPVIPYPKHVTITEGICTNLEEISIDHTKFQNDEEYDLIIRNDCIEIRGDGSGVFYALQTIEQLKTAYGNDIACMHIHDFPDYSYRGVMLDVSRHFIPLDDIKCLIDAFAFFKLNRVHIHLADDQGFRMEIKDYPDLTRVGAVRGTSNFGNFPEPVRNDGFYTQEELKELIRFAKERYIEVVPELEIPGHESAMIAAYPELGCNNAETPNVQTTGGIFDFLLCAGKEHTFKVLEDVLEEIIQIFPFELVHIGGDEAVKGHWRKCPDCQRKIRELQIQDEDQLQRWMTIRIGKFLRSKGRRPVVWNDSLTGGTLPEYFIVQNWKDDCEELADFVHQGGRVIQSSSLYLDYPYAITDLESIYKASVIPAGLEDKEKSGCLGAECALWTERVWDFDRACYLLFPRVSAVAEKVWGIVPADSELKNNLFVERYNKIRGWLEVRGIRSAAMKEWGLDSYSRKKELDDYNKRIHAFSQAESFRREQRFKEEDRKTI